VHKTTIHQTKVTNDKIIRAKAVLAISGEYFEFKWPRGLLKKPRTSWPKKDKFDGKINLVHSLVVLTSFEK
jgi:hypothetical protein